MVKAGLTFREVYFQNDLGSRDNNWDEPLEDTLGLHARRGPHHFFRLRP